jgi:hypothetical protein
MMRQFLGEPAAYVIWPAQRRHSGVLHADDDNALNNRAIQRDFASDPVAWAAHTYLELEHMSLS